jgi:hypothetical protein
MTIRVEVKDTENPFRSARLLLKFLGCRRALVIPRDINKNTVVILDSDEPLETSEKLKRIKMGVSWVILPQDFDKILSQSKVSLQKKSAFLVTLEEVATKAQGSVYP